MFFQYAVVVVNGVDCPGANGARIGPTGCARTATDKGRDVGEGAVGPLCVFQVDQPLGEKRGHVGVVGGCANESLGIAGPAQSSSRWGQSVGISMKLARCVHTMLL